MRLEQRKCEPVQGERPPLTRREVLALLPEVPGWSLKDGRLFKSFTFRDFEEALRFVKELALLAMEEGHFPDICIHEVRFVEVSWYTYVCGGLTENDFIMAAKLSREVPT
ncbi:MAG TPA: 4a-hydroxytetrahydrobiopterin dehydratase [Methanomicrobiales archaeon]|nr:4a-hydroxytetrahydrobiopterin dehydratase [Methanomicrobiales archaeon]